MNDRQQMVCAGALFADGYTHKAIAAALAVSEEEAVELTILAADEQAAGRLGHFASTRDGSGSAVVRGDS